MRGSATVWHALEHARRANLAASGDPAPVLREAGLTRRALLAAIAASGAALALPEPAFAFASGRVAVIGGGIAGLSALHHLRAAGIDARLYEARGRLGGRMFTRRPPEGGALFEDGGQLVNTDHVDIHALAAEFGIRLIDRKAGAHRTLVLADGRQISDAELAVALRGIAARIAADADRLDRDYARVAPELDRLSIAGYLDRHADAVPDGWARRLLESTARTEYGVEPHQASALGLIFNLPTVAGERVEVLGGADERYVIEGGSSTLVDALASRHAAHIETGMRLLRIDPARRALRLSFLDGSVADADRVIIAVPAPITRQIDFGVALPPHWRAFIETMALGRNEKVQIATSGRPASTACGDGGELWQTDPASGYALGWDGSVRRAQGDAPVWTWFLGGDQVDAGGAARDLAGRFASDAATAIPGLEAPAGAQIRRTAWHRDSLALGAYVNFAPGQLTRFGRLLWLESDAPAARQTAVAGRIAFAGEHLSDAFPGYMNGAAQTGRLAAEALTGVRAMRHAA